MSRGKALSLILIMILLAGGIAGGLVVAKLTTPVVKFTSQIQEGKTQEAKEAYQEKIVVDKNYSDEANEQMTLHLEKALEDYRNGTASYEEVSAQVSLVEEVMTAMDMTGIHSRLDEAKGSKDAYKRAEKALKKKNYIKAHEGYSMVVAEDSNYTAAQAALAEIPEAYKKYVQKAAKKYKKKGNITAAYDGLYEAYHASFMNNDKQLGKELKKMKNAYSGKQLNNLSKLMRQKKYQKAIKLVQKLLDSDGKVNKVSAFKSLKKKAKKKLTAQKKAKAKKARAKKAKKAKAGKAKAKKAKAKKAKAKKAKEAKAKKAKAKKAKTKKGRSKKTKKK